MYSASTYWFFLCRLLKESLPSKSCKNVLSFPHLLPKAYSFYLFHEVPLIFQLDNTLSLPQNSGNIAIHLILLLPTLYYCLILFLDKFSYLTQMHKCCFLRLCINQVVTKSVFLCISNSFLFVVDV